MTHARETGENRGSQVYLHDGTAWCFFKGDLLDG
jgi:hypothetical protein